MEREEIGFAVEHRQRHRQGDIEEPWLGVTRGIVLEQEADLCAQQHRFAAAEQVGIAELEMTEYRRIAVEAARDLK